DKVLMPWRTVSRSELPAFSFGVHPHIPPSDVRPGDNNFASLCPSCRKSALLRPVRFAPVNANCAVLSGLPGNCRDPPRIRTQPLQVVSAMACLHQLTLRADRSFSTSNPYITCPIVLPYRHPIGGPAIILATNRRADGG